MAAAAVAAGALASGCSAIQSAMQDVKTADAQIAGFHQKLNAQDFAGIYGAAGPDLKADATQDQMVQLLTAVHGKLGNFQSGADTGWHETVNNNGHFLSVTYSAKYDRGAATESFEYRMSGGQALLSGYHVSSPALITN